MLEMALFLGIVLVVFLNNIKHKLLQSKNYFLVFLMGFFTTLPHELAHYIVALILGGRPFGLYLFPKKVEAGGYIHWTFGSVNAYVNSFNGFFIGIAPIIWLVIGYFVAKYYFYYVDVSFFSVILFFLIEWILIENGLPSKTDLDIAFSSSVGVIIFFISVIGIILLLRS